DGKAQTVFMEAIPFLVTPKTSHSDERYGIMGSIPSKGDHPVLNAILSALQVNNTNSYDTLEADFATKTTLLQRNDDYYDGSHLDRYCQVVFRVSDTQGSALEDYAIELIDKSLRGGDLPTGSFSDQHKNEANGEFFVY